MAFCCYGSKALHGDKEIEIARRVLWRSAQPGPGWAPLAFVAKFLNSQASTELANRLPWRLGESHLPSGI